MRIVWITAVVIALSCVLCARGDVGAFDDPIPVDVKCPVCEEQFVYTSMQMFWYTQVRTCPWCLYSALTPDLKTVHPDDVPLVIEALDSPDRSLDRYSRDAVGLALAANVGDPPYLYRVQQLLALLCADARRDVDSDSITMLRMLEDWWRNDEALVPVLVRRRLLHELEREFAAEYGDLDAPGGSPSAVWDESDFLWSAYNIAERRIELGQVEEGYAFVRRAIAVSDERFDSLGEYRILRMGRERSLYERMRRMLDHVDIESWSVARLDEVLSGYDPEDYSWRQE